MTLFSHFLTMARKNYFKGGGGNKMNINQSLIRTLLFLIIFLFLKTFIVYIGINVLIKNKTISINELK